MNDLKNTVIYIFFNKIIKNVLKGQVIICDFTYNIGFNTIIDSKNNKKILKNRKKDMPTLYINDYDKFCEMLFSLVEEILNNENMWVNTHGNTIEEKIYFVLSLIWANATYEDFENPISFLKRYINFLRDKTFSQFNLPINIGRCSTLMGYSVVVRNNETPTTLETPYHFSISLQGFEDDKLKIYTLPRIMYGIDINENGEKVAYIYTIQNSKNQNTDPDLKKMKRELYKVNELVYDSETDEYKDFKSGYSNYYPENISDVTPSALIALTIVIGLFKSQNINIIKVPDFLPIRWFAKEEAIKKKAVEKMKKESLENIEEYLESEFKEQERIQCNVTEKFIRTFRRMTFHFSNLKIENLIDNSSFLQLYNSDNYECNNQMLEELYNIARNYNIGSLRK
jgi:hypothetical protein